MSPYEVHVAHPIGLLGVAVSDGVIKVFNAT